ncbi:SDR family oxidoreductase [Kribbella sancticallisti]|uniref:SDR family oxidoreductase n=1 Tax=Kribbella sancticallisti TaxID=460087 RepID=UPI0031CE0343
MTLVVGATGELGSRVIGHLRARGETVRCLVRTPSTSRDAIRGDLTEPGSLPAACVGVTAVVATASAITSRLAGVRRPTIREVDEVGMAALIAAAERAGVERFAYVSHAGLEAGPDSPLGRAKLATERRLAASQMRTVILRPDGFQEIHLGPRGRFDLAGRKVAIIGKGDSPRRLVSTDDVAALLATVVLEPDPPAVIEFGGPEALSRNEAVAVAEGLIGLSIKRQYMPRAAARIASRLLARPNDALASVFASGLAMDLVPADWDDAPLVRRGISPRSPTQYLEAQASGERGQ